jgi:uncharacterized protein YcbX
LFRVEEIRIYPVKSLQGISLDKCKLGIRGLELDRNWMITDREYNFVTQRQVHQMAKVKVSAEENYLILSTSGVEDFKIKLKNENLKTVKAKVWNDVCSALDEGDEVSKWLTSVIGKRNGGELRLVRFEESFIRAVDPKYLQGESSHTTFTDGFPYLITSIESLEFLNKELQKTGANPVTMDRFRANIIIKGVKAFEEFSIEKLMHESGKYSFGLRKPCQRCKVTTVDQQTGEIENSKEPLSTLLRINPLEDKKGAYFGQNSILITGDMKTIAVGDKWKI